MRVGTKCGSVQTAHIATRKPPTFTGILKENISQSPYPANFAPKLSTVKKLWLLIRKNIYTIFLAFSCIKFLCAQTWTVL